MSKSWKQEVEDFNPFRDLDRALFGDGVPEHLADTTTDRTPAGYKVVKVRDGVQLVKKGAGK
jgi:hypothetical protein